MPHVDVSRITAGVVDEAPVGVETAGLVGFPLRGRESGERRGVSGIKVGHVDNHGVPIRTDGLDIKGLENRGEVVPHDRIEARERVFSDLVEGHLPQHHPIATAFPVEHLLGDFAARDDEPSKARRHPPDPRDQKHEACLRCTGTRESRRSRYPRPSWIVNSPSSDSASPVITSA